MKSHKCYSFTEIVYMDQFYECIKSLSPIQREAQNNWKAPIVGDAWLKLDLQLSLFVKGKFNALDFQLHIYLKYPWHRNTPNSSWSMHLLTSNQISMVALFTIMQKIKWQMLKEKILVVILTL